ncbi:MAG: MarR family transcriptional regulator [Promethearchaeota archaeon]
MASQSQPLIQRFHQRQERLVQQLGIEPLPRQKDRILRLSMGDIPLHYDRPRFGALETHRADRPRRGWSVILAQRLQTEAAPILDWVLWREALLDFLLPHLRQIPEAADLGLYAGLQYGAFTEVDKEVLKDLWKQVSPPQHYQHYIYDSPFGFPLFDQVVNGTFLHGVIPWLNTLRPPTTGTPLATPTYTAALERWMLETHIPLTPPEHQILTALSHLTTPLHQSRLADQLNMSISGLSQHLTSLAQRHLLRLNHFINLPLIGLTPLEIFINAPKSKTRLQIIDILSQIRYTWFINPIQQASLHWRIFIPTSKREEFELWLAELTKKYELLPIEPLRTSDIIQSWNLDIYIPNKGWVNDFTYQLHQVQSILKGDYETTYPSVSTSSMSYDLLETNTQYPITLRPEDFTYFLRAANIHQITDRITAHASKELRIAGIAESAHMVYRRRVRELEKMDVSFIKGMFLMHIGLNTVLQIYINEPKTILEEVSRALSILPSISGLIFENRYGLLFLNIPNRSAVEILAFLRKLFAKQRIDATIEAKPSWQALSGFVYPVDSRNYDFEKRDWKWEQTTLPDLRKA